VSGGPDPARPVPPTSAAELSEDAIVRHRGDRARSGWRRALLQATGGLVNPGIGPLEAARQDWRARIRRPLPGVHRIAVVSVKGGVGKTTVAACLGLVLAENRGDRVVVLDADRDAGTLADRLGVAPTRSLRSLLDDGDRMTALADVAGHLGLAGRLHVLAADQDPAGAPVADLTADAVLSRSDHQRLDAVLGRFHDVLITDSATGVVHPTARAALDLADSLVVVGAPTVDGASRAGATLDWLDAHGHRALAADAVVALAMDRTSGEIDRDRVRDHFAARCRAVVEIPRDPHLAAGAAIDPARLQPATRDAFLLMAALLADRFGAGRAAVRR
jgi:MinD-like ATPase involved in chromosome partitioning or flagellar assembly